MIGSAETIEDHVRIHRIGGGSEQNLTLKPADGTLIPPGISTLRGGTPADAAQAMRRWFPRMAPQGKTVVGTTTAGQIRSAGFDVIINATPRFPQHARLIHPDGTPGFNQANVQRLAQCFVNHSGL